MDEVLAVESMAARYAKSIQRHSMHIGVALRLHEGDADER